MQYKIKKVFPYQLFILLKSYLTDRFFLVRQQDEYTNLYPVEAGVPQGSALGPVLYLLFTADLPTSRNATTATFADDTAIIAAHENPRTASSNLQCNLSAIQLWLNKWRAKANESKSVHVTFTLRKGDCPPVTLNGHKLTQAQEVKYLGLHLDRRLTWRKHISTKRKQLSLRFREMYWLLGRRSQLTLENKLLIYKTIIKPVWTYGIQLWGTASNSNLEILERFQNNVLRTMVDAPWYVPNRILRTDLQVATVKEEIRKHSLNYKTRLEKHPNKLVKKLTYDREEVRRLKRFKPQDLLNRFH